MEQKIYITLGFKLTTGKVNLNEIVYRLKEIRDSLMLQVLEKILTWYDAVIVGTIKQDRYISQQGTERTWAAPKEGRRRAPVLPGS